MALQSRAAASWNQNEADWRYMLANGQAWGISQEDGTLVASTVVLPYGEATCEGFAWISMVLVPPEHRRRGLASRLLRLALAELAHRGLTPILDATPAGRAVYVREGFHDTWGFKRYRRAPRQSSQSQSPPVPVPAIRPIARADCSTRRSPTSRARSTSMSRIAFRRCDRGSTRPVLRSSDHSPAWSTAGKSRRATLRPSLRWPDPSSAKAQFGSVLHRFSAPIPERSHRKSAESL